MQSAREDDPFFFFFLFLVALWSVVCVWRCSDKHRSANINNILSKLMAKNEELEGRTVKG